MLKYILLLLTLRWVVSCQPCACSSSWSGCAGITKSSIPSIFFDSSVGSVAQGCGFCAFMISPLPFAFRFSFPSSWFWSSTAPVPSKTRLSPIFSQFRFIPFMLSHFSGVTSVMFPDMRCFIVKTFSMMQIYKPSLIYSTTILLISRSRLSWFCSVSPKCCKNSSVAWVNGTPWHFILPATKPKAMRCIALRRIMRAASPVLLFFCLTAIVVC